MTKIFNQNTETNQELEKTRIDNSSSDEPLVSGMREFVARYTSIIGTSIPIQPFITLSSQALTEVLKGNTLAQATKTIKGTPFATFLENCKNGFLVRVSSSIPIVSFSSSVSEFFQSFTSDKKASELSSAVFNASAETALAYKKDGQATFQLFNSSRFPLLTTENKAVPLIHLDCYQKFNSLKKNNPATAGLKDSDFSELQERRKIFHENAALRNASLFGRNILFSGSFLLGNNVAKSFVDNFGQSIEGFTGLKREEQESYAKWLIRAGCCLATLPFHNLFVHFSSGSKEPFPARMLIRGGLPRISMSFFAAGSILAGLELSEEIRPKLLNLESAFEHLKESLKTKKQNELSQEEQKELPKTLSEIAKNAENNYEHLQELQKNEQDLHRNLQEKITQHQASPSNITQEPMADQLKRKEKEQNK